MKFADIIKRFFLITVIFAVCSTLYSQDGPSTYRIAALTTEGNKNYDAKIIIANSGLKIGQEIGIPSDDTRDAIMRLWNLNLFSDIQIVVEKKVGTDAYLIIKVKELPKLDNIKYSGNDEFSDNDLEGKINLSQGQVITPQTIKDIEYNVTKAYVEEGYPLAEVKVDQFINSYNDAQLRVKIKEGNKISVRSITFDGNKQVSSSDLRGAMEETSVSQWWKFWDKARFNRENYEKDKKLIVDYYRSKGYKDATIVSDDFKYNSTKEDMDIKIKVNEGIKYKVRNITFSGNKIYKDTTLIERLDFKRGDIYDATKFNQNLRGNENQTDVAALYLDNGYLGFNADVEEVVVNENQLDLKVHITENRQYRIGLVNITGNIKTQDKIIRRELYTLPGQYFNRTEMIRSLREISTLNYFNPERLNYDFQQRNDSTVDLVYILEEKSSDQLNASVGWSQSFGLSGSIGLVFNNFDIADPLNGGAGQILSLQWDFGSSGTYRTFSLGFTEPWLFDSPTSVGVNVFDTKQNYTYSIRETGGTVSLGRRFRFPDDYFRGDWFVKFQRTQVINGADLYDEGTRSQLSIGQTISRNSTDNPIFPTYGTRVSLYSELAGANLLGSISFHKHSFNAEAFNRLENSGKFVLYSNFLLESVSSLASDGYIPPNEFFFMGGSGLAYNTIALRGYDDRTVGPLNTSGNPVGGRVLMKYGVELRYALSLDPIPIFLLAFGEAGNVWPTFKQSDLFDLRRSVGFGARLQLPAVGIIGFDLGYGFDRKVVDGQDPSWIFHFQFGKGF
ncbi:MAG: outer membrane protein assembly factor BamA [Ignavibacteriae bacterium]|nr:MAG: outer membrane protein assembly factor BamA [Ignavibacteriota bacterium]